MSRLNLMNARIGDCLMEGRNRLQATRVNSTGLAIVMDADQPPMLILKLSAAADVNLPPEVAADVGLEFTIINASTAAATATIKNATGGAITLGALTQGQIAKAYFDGEVWRLMRTST